MANEKELTKIVIRRANSFLSELNPAEKKAKEKKGGTASQETRWGIT